MVTVVPTLLPLSEVDPTLVNDLLDQSFGPDRHLRTAYKIREGADFLPALSFAAVDAQNMLAGIIQAWPVALKGEADRDYPMIMVGPVAVLPQRQGEGYGTALMLGLTAAIDPSAPLPQVLIGDAPYYSRFGYRQAPAGWRCPGPWDAERLMVRCTDYALLPTDGMLGPWRR